MLPSFILVFMFIRTIEGFDYKFNYCKHIWAFLWEKRYFNDYITKILAYYTFFNSFYTGDQYAPGTQISSSNYLHQHIYFINVTTTTDLSIYFVVEFQLNLLQIGLSILGLVSILLILGVITSWQYITNTWRSQYYWA